MAEGIPPLEKKSDVEILRSEIRDLELQAKHPEGGIRIEGIEEKILEREAKLREAEKKGTAPLEKKQEPVKVIDTEVKAEHTPGEWRAALREMVAAHKHSKSENSSEDLKEGYFAKRSNELDGEAQKLGLEGVFRSLGEKYNKLGWKSKLAVGLGLGVGTALFSSASLPAAIACMSGIAIQRTAGMASMFLKFEKNSHEEKWGKEKAMGKAVLYTAGMTAGMLVLIAGVKEGIDFANQHDFGNATQEWLKQHWPFGEVDVSPSQTSTSSSETVSPPAPAGIAPATTETPTAGPDESALALERARAATDKAFANLNESLTEARKIAPEQQFVIDKAFDEHSDLNDALNKIEVEKFEIRQHVAEQDAILDRYNAVDDLTDKTDAFKELATAKLAEAEALQAQIDHYELQDSQMDGARETIKRLQEEAASAMAKGEDFYKQAAAQHVEAGNNSSLPAEPAAQDISQIDRFHSEIANLDTKIEDALGRRNALLGEYEAAGREATELNQRTNQLYLDSHRAFENAREHMEKYRDIIKNTNDNSIDAEEVEIRAGIRGDQEILDRDAGDAAKAYDDAKAILDDKFKLANSLKSQVTAADTAYEDLAAQKKAAFEALNADKPLESILPTSPVDQQSDGGDISETEQINRASEAPFGRDANGHPFPSEQEAKDYEDLVHKGIRDPRETGAWPPESPIMSQTTAASGSEFPAGTIRGENIVVNNSGLAISIDNPHIYADQEAKHLFVHGGSFADQGYLIQKYLAEHPKNVIYGTDVGGKYRIPWSLVGGEVTPGAPVQTNGFLGFLKSFMKAPEPDELKTLIK